MIQSRTDYHNLLLEYAVEGPQREYIKAWIEADENAYAAEQALGVGRGLVSQAVRRVRKRLAQQGASPEHDLVHTIPEGMRNRGQSIRYDKDGNVDQYWNKSAIAGRDPEDPSVVKLPDAAITKVSTQFDATGNVGMQWVTTKPEDKQRVELWRQFALDLAKDLPRVAPASPTFLTNANLLTAYPVSDAHIGMLAWDKENPEGKDWDLKIGEMMHIQAFDYLFDASPASERGLILVLGDFLHYDSWQPLTPEHKNLLDADSRAPKMIRVGMRIVRYGIERALKKHNIVDVGVEIGNHDPYSALFLMESLRAIYENEPRVVINSSPQHFHYWKHGKVLIGTHHGHGVKTEKLPLIMAADQPEWWGQTKHRVWHTGHVHHDEIEEFNGCTVEKHRILAPADAYASQKGYRTGRSMKAIVYHQEHGEVERRTVKPEMLAA